MLGKQGTWALISYQTYNSSQTISWVHKLCKILTSLKLVSSFLTVKRGFSIAHCRTFKSDWVDQEIGNKGWIPSWSGSVQACGVQGDCALLSRRLKLWSGCGGVPWHCENQLPVNSLGKILPKEEQPLAYWPPAHYLTVQVEQGMPARALHNLIGKAFESHSWCDGFCTQLQNFILYL